MRIEIAIDNEEKLQEFLDIYNNKGNNKVYHE